jgi:hypothetical protein
MVVRMSMLQAFFDDSGSDAPSPLFVLAGLLCSTEKWNQFSVEWRRILEKEPRLDYFKMSEARALRVSSSEVGTREHVTYACSNWLISFENMIPCELIAHCCGRILSTFAGGFREALGPTHISYVSIVSLACVLSTYLSKTTRRIATSF